MQDFIKELIEDSEQYLASHPIAAYFIFKAFDIAIPHLLKQCKVLLKHLLEETKCLKPKIDALLKKHFK